MLRASKCARARAGPSTCSRRRSAGSPIRVSAAAWMASAVTFGKVTAVSPVISRKPPVPEQIRAAPQVSASSAVRPNGSS